MLKWILSGLAVFFTLLGWVLAGAPDDAVDTAWCVFIHAMIPGAWFLGWWIERQFD